MIYQQTVNEIRDVATSVNPAGVFLHGRKVDISRLVNDRYPLIWLSPFEITKPSSPDNFMYSSTLTIGFYRQDSPSSSPLQREQIIAEMDALCSVFINTLMLNRSIQVGSILMGPIYQFYEPTLSGFAVRFTYQNFAPCVDV